MKPSLQLKIGQSLTMTPQLQQAIKLLQLSTLDLQQEIQEALDSNPLLEVAEEQSKDELNNEPPSSTSSDTNQNSEEGDISLSSDQQIPDDLPVDSAWDDIYPNHQNTSSNSGNTDEINFSERNAEKDSLQDHLIWQLNLTRFTDKEQIIAFTIIDAIDNRGYLTQSLEIIQQTAQKEWTDFVNASGLMSDSTLENHLSTETEQDEILYYQEIQLDEINATLKRIQQFDPAGVGAPNSEECLLIQLNQLHEETPLLKEAKLLIKEYSKMLSQKDFTQLIKKTKFSKEKLKAALSLIKGLNPYPGEQISNSQSEYVVPDVIVHKKEDRWLVELNPGTTPNLRVNATYAGIKPKESSEKGFIKHHLQEAKWFIKSLQSRNETLLKVATKIVEYQIDFFEHGAEHMRPLVLQVIAEAVEMHESTISRVTNQKYMHTPFGILELKYFFSSHVSTSSGEDCSSTAIKAMIKKLVANEDTNKPLSDSKISKVLAEEGKNVARRTVAKYREAMGIPPSNERKQLS